MIFDRPTDTTPYTKKDSYLGNPKIRKAFSRPTIWTKELIEEYQRCSEDVEYFCSRYVKIVHPDKGLVNFEPYPYQSRMWKNFTKNRFNICFTCRQAGKTSSVWAWALHFAIFNADKSIAIVAHKFSLAKNIMSKIKLAIENLPYFIQNGCKYLNKTEILFDNNSSIKCFAASSDAVRGEAIQVILLDELAFYPNDEEFFRDTYPVISAGADTKILITSTANGIGNMFHKMWVEAEDGKNEFVPFTVNWWDVPGRDEEWKRQTIANTSLEQFEVEFGNTFIGTSNTLVDPSKVAAIPLRNPVQKTDNVLVYDRPEKDKNYIMTVDVCKGRGVDYSTFTIFDVNHLPWKQVACYADNTISPMYYANVLLKWARLYNNALVVIESNDDGASVARDLYYNLEYENTYCESASSVAGIGVLVTKTVKRIGCSLLKDFIEQGQLLICDEKTKSELFTFVAKGSSYEAMEGHHDDMISNLWLFAWFTKTGLFGEMINGVDIKARLWEEQLKKIEESVPFAGIFSTEDNHQSYLEERGYPSPFL